MKKIEVVLKTVIEVPDDFELHPVGEAIVTPNNDWLKPWITWERNDEEDLHEDHLLKEYQMDAGTFYIEKTLTILEEE